MASTRERSDDLNDMLDPHREEEREAAAMELSGRLAQKGIEVGSDEDPGHLADLLSAVEGFERAVEAAGGDLFVNSLSSSEPQDARFVLPKRRADEPISRYTERIIADAQTLKQGESR
ncbi:MAG: hypothetical protein ABR582_13385 [Gemmatimonadaceae bacterium]